jgi:predicted Zn-dependent protease
MVLGTLITFSSLRAENNILISAMRDEISRSMEKLQLEELEKPYFIAYRVQERKSMSASATFASLLRSSESHTRSLAVEVRVGDYAFDNTNFLSFSFGRSGVVSMFRGTVQLSLEDDYQELRRQIWLATDGAYKKALEDLSRKRAVLQNKTRTEKIPDFSKEKPCTIIDLPASMEVNLTEAESLVRELSGLFKEMPGIFTSKVDFQVSNEYTHYLNSEGTSFTRANPSLRFTALAGTQAKNGMPLEDFVAVYGRSTDDLPPKAELAERIREMGARLQELSSAPLIERYIGPVLLEGQAVAELFSQNFAPKLLASRRSLSDNHRFNSYNLQMENPFLDKVGARVLPRFMSIVDNPTLSEYNKRRLMGSYKVDDDGVYAQETSLVERGMLKTLLTTRNPVRGIIQSTGNRRGSGSVPSNLFVTTEEGLKDKKIKQEFFNMLKQQGKDYGIVIRRLCNPLLNMSSAMYSPPGREKTKVKNIILAYKVFTNGHEELIRNAELSGISAATFKEIIAASKSQTVYNYHFLPQHASHFSTGPRANVVVSLIVPSLMLFEEMTIKPPSGEVPNPPVSKHPFFDK